MNIIIFLLVGLLAGWLASLLIEGHGLGIAGDLVVGIIGSFIGGFVYNTIGASDRGFWGAVGTSIVGAVLFLFIAKLVFGRLRLQKL